MANAMTRLPPLASPLSWEVQISKEAGFAMAVILNGVQGNGRTRWMKTYPSRETMGCDMERLGLINKAIAEMICSEITDDPLAVFLTYVRNPKETLRSFVLAPLTRLH